MNSGDGAFAIFLEESKALDGAQAIAVIPAFYGDNEDSVERSEVYVCKDVD